MKINNIEILEMQADLYGTMSNPRRLMIVEILCQGESSVGAIAKILETPISSVSQHLRVMRNKHLVVSRKEGQTVYYRLRTPKIASCFYSMQGMLVDQLRATGKIAENVDVEPSEALKKINP